MKFSFFWALYFKGKFNRIRSDPHTCVSRDRSEQYCPGQDIENRPICAVRLRIVVVRLAVH